MFSKDAMEGIAFLIYVGIVTLVLAVPAVAVGTVMAMAWGLDKALDLPWIWDVARGFSITGLVAYTVALAWLWRPTR